jgi:hypothetical protein
MFGESSARNEVKLDDLLNGKLNKISLGMGRGVEEECYHSSIFSDLRKKLKWLRNPLCAETNFNNYKTKERVISPRCLMFLFFPLGIELFS